MTTEPKTCSGSKLNIREGICYRTRDGRKVGAMRFKGNDETPWIGHLEYAGDCFYHPDAKRWWGVSNPETDLIAEWVEPEPQPAPAKPDGLWNGLRPDQKEQALAYRGPEDHGPAPAKPTYRVGDETELDCCSSWKLSDLTRIEDASHE